MANQTDDLATRAKPAPAKADGAYNANRRTTPYGEQYTALLFSTKHGLAEEGSYFMSTNPTIGTAVAGAVSATFVDTVAFFVIQNTGAAGGPFVFPDFLRLRPTVAPASATNWLYALKLEPSSLRTPSAGNATITPVNTNGLSTLAPVARLQAFTGGANLTVAAATSSARTIANGVISGVIPVINDELVISFGSTDPGSTMAGPTATASRRAAAAAPVAIPPGGSLTIAMWGLSNAATGISAEYEMGHWER